MPPSSDLIALGLPVYYAVAAFYFFYWLDTQVSARGNAAIGRWIRSSNYDTIDVSHALVEIFHRIYTRPLWRFSAISRSFLISLIVTSLAIYHFSYMTFVFISYGCCGVAFQFSIQIATNLITDYISLYIVRYWLTLGRWPFYSLLIGPIFGILLILVVYTFADVARFSVETKTFHLRYFVEGFSSWVNLFETGGMTSRKAIFLGAVAVHAWLPLLALSVTAARLINVARSATAKMQWFLKAGEKHPLRAIGFVASGVTFLMVTVLQYQGLFSDI